MSDIKVENVSAAQPDVKKSRKRNRGKKKPGTKSLITIPGLAVPVKVVTQPATAKKKELISSNWKSLMQTIAPPKSEKHPSNFLSGSNTTDISPFKRLKLSDGRKLSNTKVNKKTKIEEIKKPQVGDKKKNKVENTKKTRVDVSKKFKVEETKAVKVEEAISTKVEETEEPDIWFDDVDPSLIEEANKPTKPKKEKTLTTENDKTKKSDKSENSGYSDNGLLKKGFAGITRIIGMDCEMVGVGEDGIDSIVARVSLVNHYGHVIYDTYVSPSEEVSDYRTSVSGIRSHHLKDAPSFDEVRKKVMEIISGKLLVGHALHNDLKVMALIHPWSQIRDTSKYQPFVVQMGGTPSLKKLVGKFIGINLQEGEHCSVQDAQAAVRLYTMFREEWENHIRLNKTNKRNYNPGFEFKKKAPAKTFNTQTNSFDNE